jgi:hypothetical protein
MSASSFPSGLRVLVVDDDAPTLKVVSTMLQKCSYQGSYCAACNAGALRAAAVRGGPALRPAMNCSLHGRSDDRHKRA